MYNDVVLKGFRINIILIIVIQKKIWGQNNPDSVFTSLSFFQIVSIDAKRVQIFDQVLHT